MKKMKPIEIIETIIIFLAIISLWPFILGVPGKLYKGISYFFLFLLVGILIRRWKVLNKVMKK